MLAVPQPLNTALPPKSVAELIAWTKAAAKPPAYGSGGTGSAPHLGMEYFLQHPPEEHAREAAVGREGLRP